MKNLWNYTKGFVHGMTALTLAATFVAYSKAMDDLQEAKKAMSDPNSPDYIFQDPSMR